MNGNGSRNSDDRDGRPSIASERDDTGDAEHRDTYGVDRDRSSEADESRVGQPTVDPRDKPAPSPSTPDPGSDPDSERGGGPPEPPNSTTVRYWTGLTLALALITFATAAAIFVAYGESTAAAGAVVLGLGFGAIALAGRTTTPAVFRVLDDAWTEHRLYAWFATGLFAFGALIGALLYAAGVNLIDLFLEMIMQEFGEDELPGGGDDLAGEENLELSASFFIMNNTPPFLAAIFGALTLGTLTVIIMIFNGVLVGNIAVFAGMETGFGLIIALLAPHGIFELPALFIAAGIGFRFVHRAGQRIAGTRDALVTRSYLLRTTALVVFAWLLLVLAAFVEAYVTFIIAEALFPTQMG
ncbi:stage II sporulation protein M [Natronorubrum sp. JWXQ-INN-674]|uniref:Stage II sporulation protein M n=1 Tax=Natronorubrum halalkaliphilum TaxID=2691917 RepID=A0A6B0VNB4_9EURY|nr:stage II sporulation protein M [Natronorubrum halalkaliphilum]MXV62685.1 stage II sporulation protein M [Natronorubrum halalkaliphilum]